MKRLLNDARRNVNVLIGKEVRAKAEYACNMSFLGSDACGWTICPDGIDAGSVVYSFGLGTDITFDVDMVEKFGTKVYGFDPTPGSIKFCKALCPPKGFILCEYGIGATNGMVTFFPPDNPNFISHTMVEGNYKKNKPIEVPVYRLGTIMRMLGHDHVDILKLDVEGAEYDVVEDAMRSGIYPGQILIEFHHRFKNIGVGKTKECIARLRGNGYRLFNVSGSGEEYSFIRRNA